MAFQSAGRIFGFANCNNAQVSVQNVLFQSAGRIFGFANTRTTGRW